MKRSSSNKCPVDSSSEAADGGKVVKKGVRALPVLRGRVEMRSLEGGRASCRVGVLCLRFPSWCQFRVEFRTAELAR